MVGFVKWTRPRIMILFAVSLHLIWGVLLWRSDAPLGVTAIEALHRYTSLLGLGHYGLSVLVTTVAVLALIGTIVHPRHFYLLMPQQIVLMMSAAGAVQAMWLGQFADEVLRPSAFIAADQMYTVLAALGHTVAICLYTLTWNSKE
jgi:hypothetical protein